MMRISLGIAALSLLLSSSAIQAQQAAKVPAHEKASSWRDFLGRAAPQESALASRLSLTALQAAVTVPEVEPNDDPGSATAAAIGDVAEGVVNPPGDIDYYSFAAVAGQIVDLDVDASVNGSTLDAVLALFDTDGVTLLDFNDDFSGLDSRIVFEIPSDGTYFVAIQDFDGAGSATHTYSLSIGEVFPPSSTEVEPNDDPASANPVVPGEPSVGRIDPEGDVDFFSFEFDPATAAVVDIAIDAWQSGSTLDAFVELFDTDGVTSLAFNDDFNGLDSRIVYPLAEAGTYYVAVTDLGGRGGESFFYSLSVTAVAGGPADPGVELASGLSTWNLAIDGRGRMFAADDIDGVIYQVSPAGDLTTVATVPDPGALAVDAVGNLIVGSFADGRVVRVTPTGAVSTFATGLLFPLWPAVAPNGDIFVSDPDQGAVLHYDPDGGLVETLDLSALGGFGPGPIAFDPEGDLWVSTAEALYEIVDGTPSLILESTPIIFGFAFDATGDVYVPIDQLGRVNRYGPDGSVVADPLSISPQFPNAVAFGRGTDGAMESRLFVVDDFSTILELNSAGVPNAGATPGPDALDVSTEAAADELLGGGSGLTPEEEDLLDNLGNRDGTFDLGDFRNFLQITGEI